MTVNSAARKIASQVGRLSDAAVFALTLSEDRVTRELADLEAHKRAEAYARAHS